MVYKNKSWYKTFDETLQKGEVGEKAFIEQFKKLYKTYGYAIYDVRKYECCQKRDIDFLNFVYDKSFKQTLIAYEIKSDYSYGKYPYDKQRFFIEDISSNKQNSDGWFRYCQADIIINYDTINDILYMFRFDDLKEYINKYYKNDYKRVDYITIKYSGSGYVVNIQKFISWLEDNNKYYKVVKGCEI